MEVGSTRRSRSTLEANQKPNSCPALSSSAPGAGWLSRVPLTPSRPKLSNDRMIDHIVELVEERAAKLEAQTADRTAAE